MKILFVCSWLDVKSKKGWFFVEQAKYLKDKYPELEISILTIKRIKLIDFITTIIKIKKNREIIENKFELYTFNIPNINIKIKIITKLIQYLLYYQ